MKFLSMQSVSKALLIGLSILSFSLSAFADILPIERVKFYCSQDNRQLLVTDGTLVSIIEQSWSNGEPAGCTAQIVSSVTRSGFYCDGHWLYQYNGGQAANQENNVQTEYPDSASCQQALAAEPSVKWN